MPLIRAALLLLAAALLLAAGGCVRWYESYPEDRDGSGPGSDVVKPPPPPPGVLNHAHDTCSTAKVIDASSIPATGLVLTADHSKAQFDHKTLCN